MKKTLLLSLHALAALFMSSTFVACEEKGPMEKAGESIDEATEEVSDEVDDATN